MELAEQLKELKKKLVEILPQVSHVIGYEPGFDPLHVAPFFIREAAEVERLVWNRFCIHNLAAYLPPQKRPPGWLFNPEEKVGVLVKGCDSRSIVELLGEGILDREKLLIIGLPCTGKIDPRKLSSQIDIDKVARIEQDEQTIMVFTEQEEVSADLADLYYDKCLECDYPNPLVYDILIGELLKADAHRKPPFSQLNKLEAMSIPQREQFWGKAFSKCIRCYACRNVCPVCYCQNKCLVEARRPHWSKAEVTLSENRWFHMIRSFHVAGRCTDCGECSRVCPVNIPVHLLSMKINKELWELFGYLAGTDENRKPPLQTFQPEEEKIK